MVEESRTAGEGRGRRTARAWAAALSLAGIAGVAGVSAGSAAAAPTDLRVVLRAADPRGVSLAPVARREVEAVLLERAGEAGVVICHDGVASPGPPAFAGICAAPGPEVTPFWWDLRLDLPRSSGITIATASLRLALSAGPPQKGAPEIFLLGPFVVPSGLPAPDLEEAALGPVLTALRSSPPLLAWLRGLAARPGLLRVRALAAETPKAGKAAAAPGKPASTPPAPAMPPAPAPPTPDEAGAWNAEVLHITDLLIDGDPRAAQERADRLLREPRLPADLAARTRELQAKAAAKVQETAPPPRSAPTVPLAPKTPAAPAAASGAPAGKESREAVFPARQAAVGQGFGGGPDGQLRVTREGIAFHRAGSAAADWSVRWPDLSSASRDEGLWESPFTLVLVERGGRKRYVSVTDGHGRYVSGEPLLAAIASGQRTFRRSHDERAGGRFTGTEGDHP